MHSAVCTAKQIFQYNENLKMIREHESSSDLRLLRDDDEDVNCSKSRCHRCISGMAFVLHSCEPKYSTLKLGIQRGERERVRHSFLFAILWMRKHIKCIIVNTLKSAVTLFTPDNFFIVSSKFDKFRTKRKIFTHRKTSQVSQAIRKDRAVGTQRRNYQKHWNEP